MSMYDIPRRGKMPEAKRLKMRGRRLISNFESAVREHAFIGAQPLEAHQELQARRSSAKQKLLDFIDELQAKEKGQ